MSPRSRPRTTSARAAVMVLGAAVASGVAAPLAWRAAVVGPVERRLGTMLGRPVTLGSLRPTWRGLVASDVRIFGAPPFRDGVLARAARVHIRLGGADGFWSPSSVVVDRLDVDYVRAGGSDNLRGVVDGKESGGGDGHAPGGPVPGGRSSVLPWMPHIHVRDGRARGFIQPAVGPRVAFRVGSFTVDAVARGTGTDARTTRLAATGNVRAAVLEVAGRLTAEIPALAVERSPDGAVALRANDAILRLPGAAPIGGAMRVEGNYSQQSGLNLVARGSTARPGAPDAGTVALELDANSEGARLTLDAVDLALAPLGPLARRAGVGLAEAVATVRGRAELAVATGAAARYEMDLDVRGIDLASSAIDRRPWTGIAVKARLPGVLSLAAAPTIHVQDGTLEAFGIGASVSGSLSVGAPARGRLTLATRTVDGAVDIDCRLLLARQPPPVRDMLGGMVLGGKLAASLAMSFDAADWDTLTLSVDIARVCTVSADANVLARVGLGGRRTVDYAIRQAGGAARPFPLGPSNPAFTRLADMPPHLPAAFVTAEDAHFFSHGGFDLEMIRRALIFDLRVGAFAKGASTITQQLAKNLFLDHDRTVARKLTEAVLAWRLEALLPKNRILELYLNAIELGPGLYGVKEAARAYFGKDVAQLTPLESAHLASVAPNPRGLARRFREGRIDEGWLHRLYDLLAMMKRSGRLSATELAAATQGSLVLRKI